MNKKNLTILLLLTLAIVFLSGCDEPDPRDWRLCEDSSTILANGAYGGEECLCLSADEHGLVASPPYPPVYQTDSTSEKTFHPIVYFTLDDAQISPKRDGENYIVPYGAVLVIDVPVLTYRGIGNYTDTAYPPTEVYVNGKNVADNGWYCSASYNSCYGTSTLSPNGWMCANDADGLFYNSGGTIHAYQFLYEGLFDVEIQYARKTNASEWLSAGKFKVRTVYSSLTAIGTPLTPVGFLQTDSAKTNSILWTIKNAGNTDLKISNIAPTNCTSISCRIANVPPGTIIPARGNIVAIEELTMPKPDPSPKNYSLGLKIDYSDIYDFIKRSYTSDNINFSASFVSNASFNVQLIPANPTTMQCIGANDEIGTTGKGSVPNVLLSWKWKDINSTSCDNNGGNSSYIYCDPVQFTIELIQKLHKIYKYSNEEKNYTAASQLQRFKAYIIGDNYSTDFRKDFNRFYSTKNFMDTPNLYNEPNNPWDKYLSNETKLVFNPKALTSGLYNVFIDINYDNGQWAFFSNGEPSAKITVNFSKIENAETNPLYFLPFNGLIGTGLDDSDGRLDYGLAFNGTAIALASAQTGFVTTSSSTGAKTINTSFDSDFEKLNLEKRGVVLSLDPDNIIFSPSSATPVIMEIRSTKGSAKAHYFARDDDGKVLGEQNQYLNLWTAFSSTNNCKDFYGNELFYNHSDSKAETASCAAIKQANSFGFTWQGVQDNNMFIETIFYTPSNATVKTNLFKPCDEENIVLYAPSMPPATQYTIIHEQQALPLTFGPQITAMQDVFDLIEKGKICVSQENNKFKFWWNSKNISGELSAIKQKIRSEGNPICTTR